jgi:hypothetical protein
MSNGTKNWGKKEWQKEKYQPTAPTPETHKGKIIFHNVTSLDTKWTPNGQDITLKIGSQKVTIKPNQQYAYSPKDNRTLTIEAIPQLSKAGMKSGKATIDHPLSLQDKHIDIHAEGFTFGLTFRQVSAH